jgi:hypothetical protein
MFSPKLIHYRFITNVLKVLKVFALCTLLSTSFLCHADTEKPAITIPFSSDQHPNQITYYYEETLRLALAKTEAKYGKLDIKRYPFPSGRERQRAIIAANEGMDIMWSSFNQSRAEQLLAIEFDLLRELSNKKILLIRKEDREKFAAVKNLNDLRKFKAGTGSHWHDTNVLQKNDMPLVTSWDYSPMFRMLAARRFDYIIRGAQEIWEEIEEYEDLPLAAEETLLISYELPVYYFVNKNNFQLAKRIKEGLLSAEKDGSLAELFGSLDGFKRGREEINNNRTLLKMID